MKCEEAGVLTTRAVTGNASAHEQEALREHLALCAPCAQRDARARKVWNLMGDLEPVTLSVEKVRTTLGHVSSGAGMGRRGLWAVGIAAAALVAVTGLILLGLPKPQPPTAEPPGAVVPPRPEESQKDRDVVHIDETEKHLVDQILDKPSTAETTPAPETPERRDPVAVPQPPAPEPKPDPTPQPEPRPAIVKNPESTPAPSSEKPATPAAEPLRPTLPTVATLDRVQGAVLVVVSADTRVGAWAGQEIASEQGVEVVGLGSQAVVEYGDGTRLALGADTQVLGLTERKGGAGKQVQMTRGVLAAQVAKQPPTEPMIFTTPHAEARIMGTRFTLSVTATSTRIDVKEGRVRLTRKDDGSPVEVGPNQYAIAGKGISLAAKTVAGPRVALKEQFDRPNLKWGPGWIQGSDPGSGLRFTNETGTLSLRVPQKPAAQPTTAKAETKGLDLSRKLVSKGDWVRSIWIETRQSFAVSNEAPLRIRAKLWQSHSDEKRISWLALNRTVNGQSLLLERRGNFLQLWVEGANTAVWQKEIPAAQEWETLELWVTKDQLAVRRNDLTLHVGSFPFGAKSKGVQIAVGGSANLELPQDEEARFDDVEAAWLSRADFEDVIK